MIKTTSINYTSKHSHHF